MSHFRTLWGTCQLHTTIVQLLHENSIRASYYYPTSIRPLFCYNVILQDCSFWAVLVISGINLMSVHYSRDTYIMWPIVTKRPIRNQGAVFTISKVGWNKLINTYWSESCRQDNHRLEELQTRTEKQDHRTFTTLLEIETSVKLTLQYTLTVTHNGSVFYQLTLLGNFKIGSLYNCTIFHVFSMCIIQDLLIKGACHL